MSNRRSNRRKTYISTAARRNQVESRFSILICATVFLLSAAGLVGAAEMDKARDMTVGESLATAGL
jgi:putative copper export protein